MSYQTLRTRVENGVGLITLNRPEALNALNEQLTRELSHAVDAMEADGDVGAIVLALRDFRHRRSSRRHDRLQRKAST